MRINHGAQRIAVTTLRPLDGGFKPFRDRAVDVRSVECDTCGAAVNEFCVSASGARTQHVLRRKKALRREREESNA